MKWPLSTSKSDSPLQAEARRRRMGLCNLSFQLPSKVVFSLGPSSSLWDLPVPLLGFSAGFCPPAHRRRTQVYFFWCHKLSSNPSWWLRRECEEQGQCHIILSHKYMARIYTPSSWERHVQDFVICSSSELIAANGVMLHKWD